MRLSKYISTLFAFVSVAKVSAEVGSDGICRTNNCNADECTFTAKLNLMAGELGYYKFEECGDTVNPNIGMEVGKTYRFIQADHTNWYHPLGFAYYPDGAHAEVDELEPTIPPPDASDQSCIDTKSCPAPMYYKDGAYLGKYSNIAKIGITTGEDDFGLDHYEPAFFHPPAQWTEYKEFSVTLNFPEMDGFVGDIFYFCHIHQFMSGRIKLLKNDIVMNDNNTPAIPYSYDSPSDYDATCGTFGLEDFQLDHPECPDKFVCNVPSANKELAAFSDCIDSMNCHMLTGMTTNVNAGTADALFIHQMIPHHQNAVNMAKALMKTGNLKCDDLTKETSDCALMSILIEIINTQNAQIQTMRGILKEKYPKYPTDDCKVDVSRKVVDSSGSIVSGVGVGSLGAAGVLFAALQ